MQNTEGPRGGEMYRCWFARSAVQHARRFNWKWPMKHNSGGALCDSHIDAPGKQNISYKTWHDGKPPLASDVMQLMRCMMLLICCTDAVATQLTSDNM